MLILMEKQAPYSSWTDINQTYQQ